MQPENYGLRHSPQNSRLSPNQALHVAISQSTQGRAQVLTVRKELLHLQVHLKCCKTRDKQIDPSAQSKEADTTNQTGVLMLCLGPAASLKPCSESLSTNKPWPCPAAPPHGNAPAHCTLPHACAPG